MTGQGDKDLCLFVSFVVSVSVSVSVDVDADASEYAKNTEEN